MSSRLAIFGGAPIDNERNLSNTNSFFAGFRIFDRAIVCQTLCDPSLRDPVADQELIASLENESDYEIAPRNSVICKIITDLKGQSAQEKLIVCFPFFSSHFSMPVKTGEQVWVMREQPESRKSRAYWVSRIVEPLSVEDVNFTHGTRRDEYKKFVESNDLTDDGSGNFGTERILTFQNGITSDGATAPLPPEQRSFVPLITGSKEYKTTFFEPVPRVTKRPGDFVLQGSNNASITLGTSAGWSVTKRPNENTQKSAASTELLGSGSIDIVAGRGRIVKSFQTEKSAPKDTPPKNSTRPLVVQNELGFETDKNVAAIQDGNKLKKKGNALTNPQEGDPDFLLDASRVLVSSEIEIDKAFGTGSEGVAKSFEKEQIKSQKGAAIAVKSDHIRIIARKTNIQKTAGAEPEDVKNSGINGTIRIIKEGNSQEDLASITIEADGTIQISGSKIFLGRTKDDGGEGDGSQGDAPGNSQPYVKYQQLEDLLNATFQDIIDFATALQNNFKPTAAGGVNATPGFGGPNPALVKSAIDCTKLISQINTRKTEIQKLKSKRIFGE